MASAGPRLQIADLGGDDISGGEFPFWGPKIPLEPDDWTLAAMQQMNRLTNSNSLEKIK